ncbi:stress-inducible protein [Streptomyces carminius]|uniref:Stress-inducible protein n=1 Tax=Streptomyces carminius TaxID=2665496 RepID=A0A2M8LT53_9ACTN|nr:universal stress protein [Streptomyces carminius]PJE95121.1 stress-inducible protein [Streptomyces carminius]
MERTVIVGLDGSSESLAAADWAAREALRRGVPLRLVQVREADSHPLLLSNVDPEARKRWEEQPGRVAAELAGRHPTLEIGTERLDGRPADVLRKAADGAGLLVLGSKGRGALAGFLVGSVALSAAAHVTCPVVLVRAGTTEEAAHRDEPEALAAGGEAPYRDVVLGLDLSKPCDGLLDFAFDAAARRGAPLRVVHGWNLPAAYGVNPAGFGPGFLDGLAEEKLRALTDALRPWQGKYPDVEVRTQAVVGRIAQQLLEAAEDACLVVVGRRDRRSPLGFHIGPVAHAVMHHATVPVAVVPHE